MDSNCNNIAARIAEQVIMGIEHMRSMPATHETSAQTLAIFYGSIHGMIVGLEIALNDPQSAQVMDLVRKANLAHAEVKHRISENRKKGGAA